MSFFNPQTIGEIVSFCMTVFMISLVSFLVGGFYFMYKDECVVCGRTIFFRPIKVKKKLLSDYIQEEHGFYILNEFVPYHKKCYIKTHGDKIIK